MQNETRTELGTFILVDDSVGWKACLKDLQKQKRFAVDIEANSLYAYREKICLIQISTENSDYIVDPLADFALDGLGQLLFDPSKEKVFHASEYDLILLKREYDWDVNNLFDTMWAARILGYKNMGLAWFLQEFYGLTLSKKYQKANWAARPLTFPQLEYAQNDTSFLLRLRDFFYGALEKAGHLEEALEIFTNESRVRVPDRQFDPDAFWSIRGARDLKPRNQAVLRELFLLREEEARERNIPPFKVINNQVLILLAEAAPKNMKELREFKGLSARAYRSLAQRILDAIDAGHKASVPKQRTVRRNNHSFDPEVSDRYERLVQWRKQYAQQRGVESDVILTRQAMWEIAQTNPRSLEALSDISSLGPKRLEILGECILHEIAGDNA